MPASRSAAAHFSPALFAFLRELALNNNRAWFEANRERYAEEVRDPFLRFIGDFAPKLKKISPHYLADPRPVGGSFFRIHRDTRFARDKSPYKTMASAQFRHASGKDVHAPGFYLHLEPNQCFVGVGLWHPEPAPLDAVRQAIVQGPRRYRAAVNAPAFSKQWKLSGELLKRPPRGYPPEHPLLEELKRKDHTATSRVTEADACRANFLDTISERFAATKPYMRFLATALELPF